MNSEINEILDSIYTLMQKKDMLLDSYDSRIESLKAILQEKMAAADSERVEFNGAIAYFRGKTDVQVDDWGALMKFVKDNDAFDVLQRRVSPAQLEKRIKAGAAIEGVTITHGQTLIIASKRNATTVE